MTLPVPPSPILEALWFYIANRGDFEGASLNNIAASIAHIRGVDAAVLGQYILGFWNGDDAVTTAVRLRVRALAALADDILVASYHQLGELRRATEEVLAEVEIELQSLVAAL